MIIKRIGLFCLGLHSLLYGWTINSLVHTTDAQSGLLWIPLMFVDFPITLLPLWSSEWWGYSDWINHWNNHTLSILLSPISLVFGILGSLWWYYLPLLRLFMPSKWGNAE
ncbi:MAG: hypothetical protein B9S32_13390 [Verrucomicrobia bacterium Tous-C9LFEB]|nr:MAG: hypothetical protein B9S32_13390 [Verrucomicrobia bacterium Tous-C9LFEB]